MNSSSRPQSGHRKSLMDTAFASGSVSPMRRLSKIPSGSQAPLARRVSRLSNPGTSVVHTNPVRKLPPEEVEEGDTPSNALSKYLFKLGKTCQLSTVEDMKNGILAVLSNFLIAKPITSESADNIENAILLNRWMNKNPLPDKEILDLSMKCLKKLSFLFEPYKSLLNIVYRIIAFSCYDSININQINQCNCYEILEPYYLIIHNFIEERKQLESSTNNNLNNNNNEVNPIDTIKDIYLSLSDSKKIGVLSMLCRMYGSDSELSNDLMSNINPLQRSILIKKQISLIVKLMKSNDNNIDIEVMRSLWFNESDFHNVFVLLGSAGREYVRNGKYTEYSDKNISVDMGCLTCKPYGDDNNMLKEKSILLNNDLNVVEGRDTKVSEEYNSLLSMYNELETKKKRTINEVKQLTSNYERISMIEAPVPVKDLTIREIDERISLDTKLELFTYYLSNNNNKSLADLTLYAQEIFCGIKYENMSVIIDFFMKYIQNTTYLVDIYKFMNDLVKEKPKQLTIEETDNDNENVQKTEKELEEEAKLLKEKMIEELPRYEFSYKSIFKQYLNQKYLIQPNKLPNFGLYSMSHSHYSASTDTISKEELHQIISHIYINIYNEYDMPEFDVFTTAFQTLFLIYGLPQIIYIKISEIIKSCQKHYLNDKYIELFCELFGIKKCCKIQCYHRVYYNPEDLNTFLSFIKLIYKKDSNIELKNHELKLDYNTYFILSDKIYEFHSQEIYNDYINSLDSFIHKSKDVNEGKNYIDLYSAILNLIIYKHYDENLDLLNKSAIPIQKHFRGYIVRKQYYEIVKLSTIKLLNKTFIQITKTNNMSIDDFKNNIHIMSKENEIDLSFLSDLFVDCIELSQHYNDDGLCASGFSNNLWINNFRYYRKQWMILNKNLPSVVLYASLKNNNLIYETD